MKHKPPDRTGLLDKKYPTLTLSMDTIEILRGALATNSARYMAASSPTEHKIALKLVELLAQSTKISQSDDGFREREESMAANVNWALTEFNSEPEKSFLWAHNLHVIYTEITNRISGTSFESLGKIIKKGLNGKAYSIGLEFNRGSFIANEIKRDTIVKKVWTVEAAPVNSFPNLLSQVGRSAIFMDLNSLPNGNIAHWLQETAVIGHGIGGVYYPAYRLRRYTWPKNFDGLLFINETHAVTLELD